MYETPNHHDERIEDEYDVEQALKVLDDPDEMASAVPLEQVEATLDRAQNEG
jgi:hypothetical protein